MSETAKHSDLEFCPNCMESGAIPLIETRETIEVRGERFEVRSRFYRCPKCGGEFSDLNDPVDPLDQAYRQYRQKHGYVQPEEITAFRKKYDLTQKELAALLGWGDVTLSRYENGCLQDEAHDKSLHLAMDPRNLLALIERSPAALKPEKADSIRKKIRQDCTAVSHESWITGLLGGQSRIPLESQIPASPHTPVTLAA